MQHTKDDQREIDNIAEVKMIIKDLQTLRRHQEKAKPTTNSKWFNPQEELKHFKQSIKERVFNFDFHKKEQLKRCLANETELSNLLDKLFES